MDFPTYFFPKELSIKQSLRVLLENKNYQTLNSYIFTAMVSKLWIWNIFQITFFARGLPYHFSYDCFLDK